MSEDKMKDETEITELFYKWLHTIPKDSPAAIAMGNSEVFTLVFMGFEAGYKKANEKE